MKKIISILLTFFVINGADAQLANTSWKGTLSLDQPMDVFFNFSTDTLEVINADDNSSLETMKYNISDSVLTLTKLYGQSICDGATIGAYKCIVDNDRMLLSAISDACDDRKSAIGEMQLSKTK